MSLNLKSLIIAYIKHYISVSWFYNLRELVLWNRLNAVGSNRKQLTLLLMLPSSASYLLPDTLGKAQSFSVYSQPHSKMPTAFKPVPGSHPQQLKPDPWSEEGKRVSATLAHSSSWWLPGSYKKGWDAAGVRDVTSCVSDSAGLWPLALSSQQPLFLHGAHLGVPKKHSMFEQCF